MNKNTEDVKNLLNMLVHRVGGIANLVTAVRLSSIVSNVLLQAPELVAEWCEKKKAFAEDRLARMESIRAKKMTTQDGVKLMLIANEESQEVNFLEDAVLDLLRIELAKAIKQVKDNP